MSDNFATKVPVKEELKKDLILGLEARPLIHIILGFVSYREQMMLLMSLVNKDA